MAAQLSNAMISSQSEETAIPYKTRMGLSLFLGQPLDTSMQPLSIMATQAIYSAKPSVGGAMQQSQAKGSTDKLGKDNKSYMTPLQASESHAAQRRKS